MTENQRLKVDGGGYGVPQVRPGSLVIGQHWEWNPRMESRYNPTEQR